MRLYGSLKGSFTTAEDDEFDFIQPTLIQQLRNILDDYPDDGQILKELVQNAEDAGAKEVKFLFDNRSYGKSKLFCPELERFQGPALYAYNDAKFKEKDWSGVRMISDSIKAKDPMKVGRFGLGFKSVFHLTDLPSVVSDKYLAIIDPHEKYFGRGRTGKKWTLGGPNCKLESISEQFDPYKGIFDCSEESFTSGHYSGTLFRFPFREHPSELSETIYTTEKMIGLFECFQTDAQLTLLFLKSLESIELYVQNEGEVSPTKMFQVSISKDSLDEVRSKRKEFLNKISSPANLTESVTVTYPVTIETIKHTDEGNCHAEQHSFIVTDYYAAGEISLELSKLTTDVTLSYVPWVGVGLPIPKNSNGCIHERSLPPTDPSGHLFCFLPLPLSKQSPTGLPVHVNGFFALSKNRRHLKWPSADQDESQQLTDKALLWNRCLLRDVIPKAYATLLRQTLNFSTRMQDLSVDVVYKLWPDVEKVDIKWKELAQLFYEEVLDGEVFHTDVHGGKWIPLQEAILDKLLETSEKKEAIVRTLHLADQNVVTVPPHVMRAITSHYRSTVKEITPSLMRTVLKNSHPAYKVFDSRIKLFLLDYILSDKTFMELEGLELLPLSDGTFTAFRKTGCTQEPQVLVASQDHPQSLLPGLESMFLNQAMDSEIVHQLSEAAKTECLQLRLLKPSDVQRLLHKVLPNEQSGLGHVKWYTNLSDQQNPPKEWLEELWMYLGKNFRNCLDRFQGLHLIEAETSTDSAILAKLQKQTTLVVRYLNGLGLNDTMSNVLRKLGLTVIDVLPSFIMSHPQCFQYVNQPTAQGVLKALSVVDTMGAQDLVRKLQENTNAEEKHQLRSFLAQAQTLEVKEKQLISRLPLFETLNGSGKKDSYFVAASQIQRAAPADVLPVHSAEVLIDAKDDDCRRLAKIVGIKQLTTVELLLSVVLPEVAKNFYSETEVDRLMLYVLERLPQLRKENKNLDQYLKSLPFVSTSGDGRRVSPSELFDPSVDTLRNIFRGEEEQFPSKTFRDDTTLGELRKLGLKKEDEITANEILRSVKKVESITNIGEAENKSKAILTFLNANPSKLRDRVSIGVFLVDEIRSIRWVPRMVVQPPYYPENLPFYSNGLSPFDSPDSMMASTRRLSSLVGAIIPSVQADLYPCLKNQFYWEKEPQLEQVIAQLKTVILAYTPKQKASYLATVIEIYEYFGSKDPKHVTKALCEAGIERWVWNGDGFSPPATIILEKAFTDLSPYVYTLPSEMKPFRTLFLNCGVKPKEDQELLIAVLHQLRQNYELQINANEANVKHDLQLCIGILNELKPSDGKGMPREIREKLLLPTDVQEDLTLRLAPVEDCTYCDTEWLKQGHDMHDVEEEEDVKLQFVHRNVPSSTAECLGVPSLMSRILDPEQLGLGEEYGQSEPLTRRIHRLLEDYTDGFAVPKELIQNADDAGATEVRLLYDERTNKEARTCLIDEGMQEWQGPALWAYNDAVFTDEDFENITKLSEGTKEKDSGKIGRFGLGFNAVYNLTDVPSFVSRHNIAIFDPHTTYLGNSVKNKRKPGIKIDILKNRKKLRKLKNQFKPYNGIFGCDLSLDANETFFNGTLFRFPLRNRSQADKSEIKDLFYDKEQTKKLLEMVVKGADTLLLFTQNVQKVTLFHLPSEARDPSEAVELFYVEKKPVSILCHHGVDIKLSDAAVVLSKEQQNFVRESNFLKASSQVMQDIKQGRQVNGILPESAMNINVFSSFTKAGQVFFSNTSNIDTVKRQTWLVSSSMGRNASLEKAKGNESLRPAAGVAVRLSDDSLKPLVSQLNPSAVTGYVFCYLPMPINSGLSVHINGGFAVTSNRRYLKERNEDDKDESGGEWNEILLRDAVCKAYINAIHNLRTNLKLNSAAKSFYEVWPVVKGVERLFSPLLQAFYTSLVEDSLEIFTDGERWADMEHALFLEPELRQIAEVGKVALHLLRQLSSEEYVIVDLPTTVAESLVDCGYGAHLTRRSYGVVRFYREIFFPHIKELNAEVRDVLVLYALNANNKDLNELLTKNPCIPVTPRGDKLKAPGELVHPTGGISSVFLPDDETFPYGSQQTYLDEVILAKLVQLGMAKDEMEWDMMVERAQSVVSLNETDHDLAVRRTADLCRLLERKLSGHHSQADEQKRNQAQECLLEVPFLPVLTQPNNFPFPWQTGPQLVSAKDAFPNSKQNLVSASAPVIQEYVGSERYLTHNVKRFLKLYEKKVAKHLVLNQLKQAMSVVNVNQHACVYRIIRDVCSEIYDYLEENYEDLSEEDKRFLLQEKIILTHDGFVTPNYVARNCSYNFSPYLYCLKDTVAQAFTKMELQDEFSQRHYVEALRRIKTAFGNNILENHSLTLVVELIQQIANCLVDSKEEQPNLEMGNIYLPDSEGILRVTSELCINDCLWVPEELGIKYTHPSIPPATCKDLGVKTRRIANLVSCSQGIPFGQKEKLTNRLKGILNAYPCDEDILKELVQNADDAQATEICFINDPRQHGDKFVFEDSWKPLQGPALCVYNNKPFTRSDLHGIQSLGEGSKREDPNKTGQYGIGFNSVYHLTDVPSFMTKGAEVGDILCVFDPHCKYVPGATLEEPGRMFNDIDDLEKLYTDVFPCYKLGNRFPLENAVMFRFPLRSKKMAKNSDISSCVVTLEDLKDFMDKFKKEMFEVLLFVNNVKEISLWEIDEMSGEAVECYKVKANLKPQDEKKRQEFGINTRLIAQQLKKEGKPLSEIEMTEVTYRVTLEDSDGRQEDWLVIQRLGFEEETEIPEDILAAYKRKDLGLLPQGGVATLLSSTESLENHPMKAYCFLPLPFETALPVSINGHFALDHEARRNLWRGEDFRGNWNSTLLREVLAPCYVTLICKFRHFLELEPDDKHVTHLTCSRREIKSRLEKLQYLLPGVEDTPSDPYWITLTQSVYQYVNKHQVRILPVVRELEANLEASKVDDDVTHSLAVCWFAPRGQSKDEAFFNDLDNFPSPPSNPAADNETKQESRQEMRKVFERILLSTGFNLVEYPLSVYKAFRDSYVNASVINPTALIEFYKSFNKENPLCNIGCIPSPLSATPFQSELALMLVLEYCKRDGDFINKLDGLPLLLTKDYQLREFSSQKAKFLSKFSELLPQCSEKFVHPNFFNFYFKLKCQTHDVFKVFDVKEFARLLSHALSEEKYHVRSSFSDWSPNKDTVPNQRWLQLVWKFLGDQVNSMLMDKKEASKEPLSKEKELQEIKKLLEPLQDWSILPATVTETSAGKTDNPQHILVSLKLAPCILHFRPDDKTKEHLHDGLRELGLPELNMKALNSSSFTTTKTSRLPSRLVATVDDPAAVLESLREKMDRCCLKGKLSSQKARLILAYFNDNIERLQDCQHAETLKRLPLHEAIHGDLIEITNQLVWILPRAFPKAGIDVVEKSSDVVFLKENMQLEKLHKFLGCKPTSAVDVYCDVVFPHFCKLGEKARVSHLEYIRDRLLPKFVKPDEKDSREKLISGLSALKFLPHAKNHFYDKASSFYDPSVEVFKVMLPSDCFPPEPFHMPEWIDFLRKIGLVKEVTSAKFVEFANEVAHDTNVFGESTRHKSKTLVSHLFSRNNLAEDRYLLQQVSSIPFIAPEHVDQKLSGLHPQYKLLSNGHLSYFAFENSVFDKDKELVWTTAHLLPQWASPHSYYIGLKRKNDCVDSVIKQLKILQEPCLHQVMEHCKNLCHKLVHENDKSEHLEKTRFETKKTVMNRLYKFFQSNIIFDQESDQARRDLQSTPCILVESGRRFVYPNQVVTEFFESQEIKPYLYAAPGEFGAFRNIFEQIGCPRNVGCKEYAMVLRIIQKLWPEENVTDPNARRQVLKALKGFFKCLEELETEAKSENLKMLYLPGCENQSSGASQPFPLFLRQAKTLIYNDAPRHSERLKQFSEMFLVDLKACGIKSVNLLDDLLIKIPREHRPKLLSEVVKEELADKSCPTEFLGAVNTFKQTLASQEFCRGVVRLIRHENHRNEVFTAENIVTTIERKLRNIKFYGLKKVVTHLVHRGEVIPGSKDEVSYHQTQQINGNEVIWKIYLSESLGNCKEIDAFLSLAITSAVAEIAGGQLRGTTSIVSQMLSTPIHKIWWFLDHLKIRQDDSYDPSQNMPLPEPGSFIPIENHHLLDNEFNEFEVDDYVGFEVHDGSSSDEDGCATFIYAVIIEKIRETGGDVPSFKKKYKINIGCNRDPVVVSASKLYKFHRVLTISPEDCVMFDDEENKANPQKLQEIFREITEILEDAWRLPEEERRRIIKRLYLRWHPDKNLGNEDFCNKVCHHIQREIERLSSRANYNHGGYSGGATGFYGGFFAFWGKRASNHRKSRDRYRTAFSQHYPRGPGSFYPTASFCSHTKSVPPSFHTANPQPQEAKRWLRQAELDFEAASNDMRPSTEFNEWACFKYHQAAEKALKAAHYMLDADKTDTHNLVKNANRLDDAELNFLSERLENLLGNSDNMRYPDTMCYPSIPHEVYTEEMAAEGQELAQAIVSKVALLVRGETVSNK